MKKIVIAAAFVSLMSVPAFAASFTITNHSGADWDEIGFSAPGKDKFDNNLLKGAPDKSFENGMTYKASATIKAGTYDVRVYDEEDPMSECILKDVKVDGKGFEFTETLRKSFCKS